MRKKGYKKNFFFFSLLRACLVLAAPLLSLFGKTFGSVSCVWCSCAFV